MLRYDFLKDLDDSTKSLFQQSGRFLSRLPLCILSIPPSALSPDGSKWLHCVEAKKEKEFLRIRVIIKEHRGATITIHCDSMEMYYKYIDLRFQVRNSDYVAVTFPEIYVGTSPHMARELYLTANDFKLRGLNRTPEPAILV